MAPEGDDDYGYNPAIVPSRCVRRQRQRTGLPMFVSLADDLNENFLCTHELFGNLR